MSKNLKYQVHASAGAEVSLPEEILDAAGFENGDALEATVVLTESGRKKIVLKKRMRSERRIQLIEELIVGIDVNREVVFKEARQQRRDARVRKLAEK